MELGNKIVTVEVVNGMFVGGGALALKINWVMSAGVHCATMI